MRTYKLFSLLLLALLAACATTPPSESSTAESQPASTSPAIVAADPTSEPSATVEPSPTPLPFSGSTNPRLAMVVYEGEQPVIQVIELGSEQLVASIPVEEPWKMALSPDGRTLFYYPVNGPGIVYDLESGETSTIDLSGQLQGNDFLHQAVWSPSQQWLSFDIYHENGRRSLWAYSLETGRLAHVDDIGTAVNWSSREDVVSYFRDQRESFPRFSYNLSTGERSAWPPIPFETAQAALTHDGLVPDSFGCLLCVLPDLGQVRDYTSYNLNPARFDYHLFDAETLQSLAYIATFQTERELIQNYTMDVVKVLPLQERGDYLLLVNEVIDITTGEAHIRFYSAWNPAGEMPFTLVDGEDTNKLPYVNPMALSPDGASFVGLRFTSLHPFFFVLESAVVVDLATAEILYEYSVPSELVYFSPPDQLSGAHMVWPQE